MTKWVYDIGTQAIAGLFSGAVVGGVLLYSQFRMERRMSVSAACLMTTGSSSAPPSRCTKSLVGR